MTGGVIVAGAAFIPARRRRITKIITAIKAITATMLTPIIQPLVDEDIADVLDVAELIGMGLQTYH
jgi:hypothetical protein